jgi:hypothetical protein
MDAAGTQVEYAGAHIRESFAKRQENYCGSANEELAAVYLALGN